MPRYLSQQGKDKLLRDCLGLPDTAYDISVKEGLQPAIDYLLSHPKYIAKLGYVPVIDGCLGTTNL